jgi:hypothetical protein
MKMKITKVKPVVAIPKTNNKKNPYVFDPKTDKVVWRNPTPLDVLERRAKEHLYKSDIDPAVIIHSNKTHRTVSEAFRDADYATPIWRCENDWDRAMEYLKWIGVWAFTFFMLYNLAVGFEKWIAS